MAHARIARTCLIVLATGAALVAAVPAHAGPAPVRTVGVASTDGSGGAWTYNDDMLPAGARLSVHVAYPGDGMSVVTLTVKGVRANREYGAHAHKAACTSNGADALGHFQYLANPDLLNPTDPTYANPTNEIWLDLQTNSAGNATSKAVVPWQPDVTRPMSVVIHEMHTGTGPGDAGTAGARLACMTVPF
ncbi:MAG: superoxide dismutase [Actinomycetes bacterium]